MSTVSVESVSRTLEVLLAREGRSVVYCDRATGHDLIVSPPSAASPSGLLPAFVVAGEAIWREATGRGFSLDVAPDPQALLGYRLRGIGAGHFATVMLATMEAAAQVSAAGGVSTTLVLYSRSVYGYSDLGANRQRLSTWLAAMQARLNPPDER